MTRSLLILLIFVSNLGLTQVLKLSESRIEFLSEALIEDIQATNSEATGLWDLGKGEFAIIIPMNKFQFENSLMQEHFNEKYLETDKFPKAYFSGSIIGFNDQPGKQMTEANGTLSIHGVEKMFNCVGDVNMVGDEYQIHAEFKVRVKDHKIKIPRLMWQNIAEVVNVTVFLKFTHDE